MCLITTNEQLQRTKVRIPNKQISKLVQERAFQLGFEWSFSGKKVTRADSEFLFFYKEGGISYADAESSFSNSELKEISYEQIIKPSPKIGDYVRILSNATLGASNHMGEIAQLENHSGCTDKIGATIRGEQFALSFSEIEKVDHPKYFYDGIPIFPSDFPKNYEAEFKQEEVKTKMELDKIPKKILAQATKEIKEKREQAQLQATKLVLEKAICDVESCKEEIEFAQEQMQEPLTILKQFGYDTKTKKGKGGKK